MIGLIGGVGSRASAGFVKKLTSKNLGLPFLLFNNPTIQLSHPDRNVVLDQLKQSVTVLVNGGCTTIAILCNTAHMYLSELKLAFSHVHFIDMIEITVQYILSATAKTAKGNDGESGRLTVGLLTTKGVIQSCLYHNTIDRVSNGTIDVVLPLEQETIDGIHDCIYSIIGGKNVFDLSSEQQREEEKQRDVDCVSYICQTIEQMKKREHGTMRAIVFGCTDLSDLISTTDGIMEPYGISSNELLVVDPLEVLTQHIIELYNNKSTTKN